MGGQNEADRKEKQFKDETFKEAGIEPHEEFKYMQQSRDWVVPETNPEIDTRHQDLRYVAGGAPKQLDTNAPALAVASEAKPTRKIKKYSTGEPDKSKNNQTKVYIEDPEVLHVDEGRIKVDFKQTSYSVRVNTESATYVLGPIECGHIM